MRGKRLHWGVLLPSMMLLFSMLACGGFQLRGSPTTTPAPRTGTPVANTQAAQTPTGIVAAATEAPTAAPSATPTTSAATGGLATGGSARVAANGGLNVRDKAGRAGKQVGKLDVGVVVTVRSGPTEADGYTWWEVDNGAGLSGWVAGGPQDDPWLVADKGAAVTPATSGGKLVQRAIKVGDRVQVTTQEGKVLTVRESAGKDAKDVARALAGATFTVQEGPVQQDGMTWWHLKGEQVAGWAADGDGTDRWLTPVEP